MLLAPAYQIVIASRKVDTTDEPLASTVEELRVDLDMETPADTATLRLGNVGGLKPEQDDEAAIKLGYLNGDDLTLVFTGRVLAVDTALDRVRVVAHSPAQKLLDRTIEKTFENKSGGDIVRALAAETDITVAQADSGPVFPAFVADGARSLYHHIRYLAELCGPGFVVYTNPAGELVFRQIRGGGRIHVFEYSKHIVSVQVRRGNAGAQSVTVMGESPGTSRGSESWAWLTKDFSRSKGTAGSGSPVRLLEYPAARTRELAQGAADQAFRNIQRNAVRGTVVTFGRPEVQLGDGIRIKDAPDDRVNGDFEVLAVRHRITKVEGFTTEVEFRGAV